MTKKINLIFLILGLVSQLSSQEIKEGKVGEYSTKQKDFPLEIPFDYYGMNIMIKAEMNGININLLVDNGVLWDELWFYGNNQTDSLGFVSSDSIDITGAGEGGTIESVYVTCPPLHFDQITFYDQPAILSPPEQGFYKMFPGMAGQICGSFFRNFITEFDFQSNKIRLHQNLESVPIDEYTSLNMTKDESGAYSIPITINTGKKSIATQLFIDLGGIYPLSLVLNKNFAENITSNRKVLAHGASGPIYGYEGEIKEVYLGGVPIKDVGAVFTEDETGGNHTNLTIGLPLFKQFKVIFDYSEEVLYLKKY